jgi:hypothetical protein
VTKLTYATKENGKEKGSMRFTEEFFVQDGQAPKGKFGFLVTDFQTAHHLAADTKDQKDFWCHAIANIIRKQLELAKYFEDVRKSVKVLDEDMAEKQYQARLDNYYKTVGRPIDKQNRKSIIDIRAAQVMAEATAAAGEAEKAKAERKEELKKEAERLAAEAKMLQEQAELALPPDSVIMTSVILENDSNVFEEEGDDDDEADEDYSPTNLDHDATADTSTPVEKPAPELPPRKTSLKPVDIIPSADIEPAIPKIPTFPPVVVKSAFPEHPVAPVPVKPVEVEKRPSFVPPPVAKQAVEKRPSMVPAALEPKVSSPAKPVPETKIEVKPQAGVPVSNFESHKPVQPATIPKVEAVPATSTVSKEVPKEDAKPSGGIASKLGMWQNKVDNHQQKQAVNAFSGAFQGKKEIDKDHYGKAPEGSKTEERAKAAQDWVEAEIEKLIKVMIEMGTYDPEEGGVSTVQFGPLFYKYADISDTLVGILMRAKKRKRIMYKGDMLFQNMHDHVKITVLQV